MKALLLALLCFASGASGHDAHKHAHHKGPPPAPAGFSSLDVYRDGGRVHLLRGMQEGERVALWHQSSGDGRAWSAPARVDRPGAEPSGVRPNNDAQIAARGEDLVAVWSVAGTGWGGSGPLASALSADGGKTWRAGPNPSDTGLTTGHGFTDLLVDGRGLHAVWLDGRDKAQGLRYALSGDMGRSWRPSVTVAAGTCECCWNSLASVDGNLLVMYRGKDPRDMRLATRAGGAWRRGGAVGSFGWQVKGCPENGGALASTKQALHALVWTGHDENLGLHALASSDAGATWTAPLRMGTKEARHGDLAAAADGTLFAAWDDDDVVVWARSVDAGRTWSEPQRLSAKGVAGSFPRIAALEGGVLVVWGEQAKGKPREMRQRLLPLR